MREISSALVHEHEGSFWAKVTEGAIESGIELGSSEVIDWVDAMSLARVMFTGAIVTYAEAGAITVSTKGKHVYVCVRGQE